MKEKFETIIAFPGLNSKRVEPPVNVLPMASCVERQGLSSVRVVDGESLGLTPEQLAEEILINRPEIVGVSVYTPTYPKARDLIKLVKTLRPEAITVLGGKHPTHFYREVLEDKNVDIVVVGEGEEVLPQIVASLTNGKESLKQNLQGKPGIAFKNDADVALAPKVDLKTLPPLDFKFLYPELEYYLQNRELIVDLESSRGCFGHCSFCLAARYRKGLSFKEPERFTDEIQCLIERGVKNFFLTDDDFMANFSHASQVIKLLNQRQLSANIEANVRADSFLKCIQKDPQILIECCNTGIKTFHIGVESANPEMLEYCRKNINLPQVEQAVKIGTANGLTIIVNFIAGFPYDTEHSITDSIIFAERLKILGTPLCHTSIFMPYPGTETYDDAVKEGLLDPRTFNLEDLNDVHDKVVIPTKFLTKERVRELYNKSYETFYSPEYLEKLRLSSSLTYQTALYLAKKRLD